MYALATLLAVLAVWAARRVWQRGRRRDAALYVAATAAGLYTLYLFAPVWLAINVAWLWTWRAAADRRRALWRWAGLQLLIAALFLPVRRRVQDWIDRRFNRTRYDAEKTLAAFAATARDETDLDALLAELVRVIGETMEPEQVSVWLRPADSPRPPGEG